MTYICGEIESEMENEVNEGMISYGLVDDFDLFRLIEAVRKGISYLFFLKLARNSPFSLQEWSGFLHLSERTMQRYKKEMKPFDPVSSEKILEITMLYKYGIEIFGDKHKLGIWLNSDNVSLGGRQPKDLLDSSFGLQWLHDELGRIEQGILA